jgi:DNA repair protein RadC
LTKRLGEAAELLGIALLDHVVFGDGRYVSLKERNLM